MAALMGNRVMKELPGVLAITAFKTMQAKLKRRWRSSCRASHTWRVRYPPHPRAVGHQPENFSS
jgi:hypothetical protein